MCKPDLHLSIKRLVHGDKREWDLFVEHFSAVTYSSVYKTFFLHIKQIDKLGFKIFILFPLILLFFYLKGY